MSGRVQGNSWGRACVWGAGRLTQRRWPCINHWKVRQGKATCSNLSWLDFSWSEYLWTEKTKSLSECNQCMNDLIAQHHSVHPSDLIIYRCVSLCHRLRSKGDSQHWMGSVTQVWREHFLINWPCVLSAFTKLMLKAGCCYTTEKTLKGITLW